ncbi:GMC family oxidoreductase N-terminal domain-containing protein [Pseudoduganella violaceinigra]|uniref:GMC family oxidoreductase N-terminal domain-containing protein n=1 Tax=Pseudoduganella violaceinigra TaxID=246602 RepID=UPI0004090134|nr:GMC family oxidoreductase N-terminal domain-containing protein [Pseudoduganella violaceinigra]
MPNQDSLPSPALQRYDVIVVGSGPGGASVAQSLARQGQRVLVLEQGSAAPLRGTLAHMASIGAIPGKGAFFHRDASLLVRGLTAGGSSAINFATAATPPLERFTALGIDLAPALAACRAELPIGPLPDSLLGPMARRIMQAALAAGLPWHKLDKMIRPAVCRTGCWRCVYGCPFGAKWSARDLLDEARLHGAHLLDCARATRVLLEQGRAAGVEYLHGGALRSARAPTVVLAGGGIGSPRLLHASGLAPRSLPFFSDPVVAVMGTVDDIAGGAEVPMAAGMALPGDGLWFSDLTLPKPMYQAFALQVGRVDRLFAHRRTLSIMVKIRDQAGGGIGPRWADKTLQPDDRERFQRGVGLARNILSQAGARHVFKSWHFAAHPGGALAVGGGGPAAVDSDLRSATPGLYVCDASVLPAPWGMPPTLTLLALGKRLGYLLGDARYRLTADAASPLNRRKTKCGQICSEFKPSRRISRSSTASVAPMQEETAASSNTTYPPSTIFGLTAS